MVAVQRTAIEELCAIAGYLLADGTYDEEGVAAWLCSPHGVLNGAWPMDAVRQARFVDVLAAAEATQAPVGVQRPGEKGPLGRAIDERR